MQDISLCIILYSLAANHDSLTKSVFKSMEGDTSSREAADEDMRAADFDH